MKSQAIAKKSRMPKPNPKCLQGPLETCYDGQLNATARDEAVKAVSSSALPVGCPLTSKLATDWPCNGHSGVASELQRARGRRRTTPGRAIHTSAFFVLRPFLVVLRPVRPGVL